jgi:phage portal protein BeeE
MVGGESGGSMTYANVEQRNIEFLTYSVAPWLKRIEDAMFPLLPGAKYVRFNTGALLRTDLATRYQAHAVGIAAKFLTPDEARAFEEMPPLTAAQKALLELVPLEVTPSGKPKSVPGTTTVPEGQSVADPNAGETP